MRADAHPEIPRKWRWHPRIDGRRVRDMRVYTKWLGMFSRCYNKNGKNYRYYGGRGIKVCERWHNFQNFLADMGHPPEGMSLDRINPNGNYSPKNCRWATKEEQAQNRRNIKQLAFAGKTLCLQQWSDSIGIKLTTLYQRIYAYKWPLAKALSTPLGKSTWTKA